MKKKSSPLPTIADLATLASLASGMLALASMFRGRIALAGILLLAAVLLDWLDGRIARRLRSSSPFGGALDSIVDMSSFAAVPVVLVFLLVGTSLPVVLSAIIFACAGAYRLARFSIRHSSDGFEGMPITANGIIFGGALLAGVQSPTFYIAALLASAILMVSTFRVRKI